MNKAIIDSIKNLTLSIRLIWHTGLEKNYEDNVSKT